MAPMTVHCTYLVKPEQCEEFGRLLTRHWPTLRKHELVTPEPPIIFRGEDYSGPFFVEILTWVDSSAAGRAYWIQEINQIWTDFYAFTEARDSRPGIDYPAVAPVPIDLAADSPVPSMEAMPAGESTASSNGTLNWDDAYRSGQYLAAWDLDRGSPELVDFLSGRQPTHEETALDLGCGSGSDCMLLARAGYATSGIDISAEALAIAEERGVEAGMDIAWKHGDVLCLPFEDASFDLITDRGCFHHVRDEDRGIYAQEVSRVLKPGGTLFLRGCRTKQVPFVPLTDESISRSFPPSIFIVSEGVPLDILTGSGVLPGNMYVIHKNVHEDASHTGHTVLLDAYESPRETANGSEVGSGAQVGLSGNKADAGYKSRLTRPALACTSYGVESNKLDSVHYPRQVWVWTSMMLSWCFGYTYIHDPGRSDCICL